MTNGKKSENQAANLKKILAEINAQQLGRESLLSDEETEWDTLQKSKLKKTKEDSTIHSSEIYQNVSGVKQKIADNKFPNESSLDLQERSTTISNESLTNHKSKQNDSDNEGLTIGAIEKKFAENSSLEISKMFINEANSIRGKSSAEESSPNNEKKTEVESSANKEETVARAFTSDEKMDTEESSSKNKRDHNEDETIEQSIDEGNETLLETASIRSEKNDYVPYGHYEKVTDHSDDIIYYDSDLFQEYVKRSLEKESDLNKGISNQNVMLGKSEDHIKKSSQNENDYLNSSARSNEDNQESTPYQSNVIEMGTLNLPPRREVHRKSKRKLTLYGTRPLLRLGVSVCLTLITVGYLFYSASEELIDLFQLKQLLNWFL